MKAIRAVLITLALLILVFLIVIQAIHKAEIADGARSSESAIVFLLKQRVAAGTLPNIRSGSVLRTFVEPAGFPNQTNAQGEIIDPWNVPFQIEIAGQTNFIVRSAGPDKKFGDADDIIFNSTTNDFVKP